MNPKIEEYFLKRRRKGIRLVVLAPIVGCSQSLLSKYETGVAGMSKDKIERYREYIDAYKENQ
ncbi:helix-turn-helix transcriptional regulator [Bacillus badius]|uniref:helix-turn-helix domain-containing protein n=1 Tax=Bacillus badius TaxID=1455 RepID=UPI002E24CED8|nr:helix-turn-helix transcriptional regulator [Bacillus badius]